MTLKDAVFAVCACLLYTALMVLLFVAGGPNVKALVAWALLFAAFGQFMAQSDDNFLGYLLPSMAMMTAFAFTIASIVGFMLA